MCFLFSICESLLNIIMKISTCQNFSVIKVTETRVYFFLHFFFLCVYYIFFRIFVSAVTRRQYHLRRVIFIQKQSYDRGETNSNQQNASRRAYDLRADRELFKNRRRDQSRNSAAEWTSSGEHGMNTRLAYVAV